ncbi:ABC transporter C member 13 [Coemansia sp. S146]|nr:ABC transporter C member 13 [Coemansia sp. S146]
MTEHIETLRYNILGALNNINELSELVSDNSEIESAFRYETFNTISHVGLGESETVPSISLDNCSFKWRYNVSILKRISLNVAAGELVAVVGKTGSGKTSLMLALCKEMQMTRGTGKIVGRVGYLEQSPWIMNATMRANIIFGREFDEDYYWKVIHACALTQDLESWPDRDLTMIGERGINISGGQRARLALARTVYSQADVYILDDPLSAVDAHVKRHILDNVILSSGLLGNKLRVVTTHSESMLPFCSQIVTVSDETVSVVRQEPKEHQHVAIAAVAPNNVCEPTIDASDSDSTLAASTTLGNSPVVGSCKHKKQTLPQNPTLWDNAKYVFNGIKEEFSTSHSQTSSIIDEGGLMIRLFGVESYFMSRYISDKDEAMKVRSPQTSLDLLSGMISTGVFKVGDLLSTFLVLVQSHLTSHKINSGQLKMLKSDLSVLVHKIGLLVKVPSRLKSFSNEVSTFRQFSDFEPEAPYIADDCRVPSEWPHSGNVEFKNLSVRYGADLDYALKNLNFTIRPGEKIGIVGRTGAGKSTLAKAIFRLLNKNVEGSIEIDGHDTASFGVGDFRPKLGIIPQESTIFSGTVKRNLDPLKEFTIEDMWAAMIKCGVTELIKTKRKHKPAKLAGQTSDMRNDVEDEAEAEDEENEDERATRLRWESAGLLMRAVLLVFNRKKDSFIDETRCRIGINKHLGRRDSRFSSGQQQLFSLCRLVMRKRKVLILDEATADVDQETDRKMQELIRTEFSECTILTIAHRLDTIMNSDRIIVMEKGEIAEIGPPQELIANGGMFAELVQANEF